jgi:hypothetical protein
MKMLGKKRSSSRVVILVGHDTAGYLSGLEIGFRAIGWTVINHALLHEFNYSGIKGEEVKTPKSQKILLQIVRYIDNQKGFLWREFARSGRIILRALSVLSGATRLPRSLRKLQSAQVVIYNSATTLSGLLIEARIIKYLGAKVVFSYHGSDIRPVYLDGAVWRDSILPSHTIAHRARRQRRIACLSERYGSLVIAWSGITHFLTGPVLLHERAGFPLVAHSKLANIEREETTHMPNGLVRVLHVPSNPSAKGSDVVIKAVKGLWDSGVEFRFDQLTAISHDKCLTELANSQVVIDQVLSDSASGVLAAESSLLGTPVLIAGKDAYWFKEKLGEDLPKTNFVQTDDIASMLSDLIKNSELRLNLGRSASEYFHAKWAPINVVKLYLEALSGSEQVRLDDSLEFTLPRGGFALPSEISAVVEQLVTDFGIRSLQLEHNLPLRDLIVSEFL